MVGMGAGQTTRLTSVMLAVRQAGARAAGSALASDAYFPFAGGLRGCIGGHFAMTEAVIAISTLLTRFSVASESPDIPLLTDITLRPAIPVRCRLDLRQPVPAGLPPAS